MDRIILTEILFLTKHSPFLDITGGHQRTRLLCIAFSKFANVDVLTLEQDIDSNIENCSMIKFDADKLAIQSNFLFLFFSQIYNIYFRLTKMLTYNILGGKNNFLSKQVINLRKNKHYDFIFIRYINNLRLYGVKPDKSVILDVDDHPEYVYQSRYNFYKNNNSFKGFIYRSYYSFCKKTSAYYTKKITDKISVAYLPDKELSKKYKNAVYLPNIPYINKQYEKSDAFDHKIMFVGLIEYQSNYSSLEYFLNNIFPLIVKEIPDVVFDIVGSISDKRKAEWLSKYKNISIPGFVDNLTHKYQNCSLVVVPVYLGGGTNIKVLEAMNMGKACVISSFAAKGFEDILVNGENILIADNDTDFSDKVIKLLKNKEYRENTGKMAKETINNSHYSLENFLNIVKNTFPVK